MGNLSESMTSLKDSFSREGAVLVDTEEVTKIDIAAVQMLVAAHKESLKNGRELILRKSDKVKRLLKSMGVEI
jgi:anti-anti-sigma regulatory factor